MGEETEQRNIFLSKNWCWTFSPLLHFSFFAGLCGCYSVVHTLVRFEKQTPSELLLLDLNFCLWILTLLALVVLIYGLDQVYRHRLAGCSLTVGGDTQLPEGNRDPCSYLLPDLGFSWSVLLYLQEICLGWITQRVRADDVAACWWKWGIKKATGVVMSKNVPKGLLLGVKLGNVNASQLFSELQCRLSNLSILFLSNGSLTGGCTF